VFGAVCVFVCVQQLVLELRVADDTLAVGADAPPARRGVAIAR
jgi:hypothetical protein